MREIPIQPPQQSMFVTWNEGDEQARAIALREAGAAMNRVEPVVRSHGSNIYLDIAPQNVSVRDGFNRRDYEYFRPENSLPQRPKEIISACSNAYDNVGIIRNVIDLMADFSTQGIDIIHPNERIEKWHKEWFLRVNGKERSERFVNLLFRTANVIVKRSTAKISKKIEREMMRAQSAPDIVPEQKRTVKREIPWGYTFLNPMSVEFMSPELSSFLGGKSMSLSLQIPRSLIVTVNKPRTDYEKNLVAKLPEEILRAIRAGQTSIVLDPDKVSVFHYKKDDWDAWAKPMVFSILGDIEVLQKMKLADVAALDGAISCIRVWRLGNIEHRIMPTTVAINKLAEMLTNNVGGGVMDLVWGPEIDLIETKTDVHHFLGQTKYEPTLTAIYAGLGIPPTLTGASSQSGFTNNYISLKTMTERLQYAREVLTTFWNEELHLIQKAMGFRFAAKIVFDRMTLSDEAAEKQLLVHLWDRNLISDETIRERFGETPEIESVRVRRENNYRESGKVPPKTSPFHVDQEFELTKLFVQQRTLTPSEVGVELEPRKPGEQTGMELEAKNTGPAPVFKPKGQPGRPKNTRDSQKRKRKRVVPRTSAVFFQTMSWAEQAQAKINEIAGKAYLKSLSKRNMRELTDAEMRDYEQYKFHLLCQFEPNTEITSELIAEKSKGELSLPHQIASLLSTTIAHHVKKEGREPTLETMRRYRSGIYAFWKGNFDLLV
jgi:hypothetical protein